MDKNLLAMRDWMNSPEFEISAKRFFEKLKREDESKDRHIQYIHDNYKDRLDEIIPKLIDKYGSSEYIDREYGLGYQPRETLLWVMLTYAKKYGIEFTDEEYENYIGMFTTGMYHLGDWVFEVLQGQGSALLVYKKEELK
jgi:hypothetical protein